MLKKLLRVLRKQDGAGEAMPESTSQRAFNAAQVTHLTSGWTTSSMSADAEIRNSLPAMRARSRDLAVNNDYMRHFLQMVATNVIGHNGFALQMRVKDTNGKADQLANKAIESAVAKWSKRGTCEVTGKLSFSALQRLVARTVARDGEAIVRKVRDRKLNLFGFALQLIAIDRLDTSLNQLARNGNVIRMSVEINSYGRPVAYHLRTDHPGDGVYIGTSGQRYERVPADDIVHLFVQEDPEQTRGIPWAVSAMTRLNHLGAFDEAAVIAARIGASKMGFFKQADTGGAAGEALQGQLMQEASPGEFGVLPVGVDFESFNPDYPHANYGPFTKACLRGIAAGLGVSYNGLANDLEGVSYSSLRAGTLAERDEWMTLQDWLADGLLGNVFEDWLRMSLLTGAIMLPNGAALPPAKYDKFNSYEWQGRRWPWVDPVKDITAAVLAINNKLGSRSKVLASQGGDFADIAEQLQQENELLTSLGLNVAPTESSSAPPKDAPDKNDAEE